MKRIVDVKAMGAGNDGGDEWYSRHSSSALQFDCDKLADGHMGRPKLAYKKKVSKMSGGHGM